MEFGVLGPLEVRSGGLVIPVRSAKRRVVLAVLLLRVNRVVPVDELVDVVWGEHPPRTAQNTLSVHVGRLRRLLETDRTRQRPRLVWWSSGYQLRVEPDRVDHCRFDRLVAKSREAKAAGELERATRHLREALQLWRGRALADVASAALQTTEALRLEEQRASALEERIQLDLDLGRHLEVVGELEALVAAQPLRERLRSLLMLALYRSGRQAEALAVYRNARQVLAEELGIEPCPELQRIERAILAGDRSLELPGPALAVTGVPPSQLPSAIADFVGRTVQLDQLDRLLEADGDTTAVVISAIAGTAGVGKTALAVQWAHQVRGRFPDGQLYVGLRGYSPGPPISPIQALVQLLRGLGVDADKVPVEVEEAAGLYRSLLADKRVLIVLDNARDAEHVRPLLPGSPGCLVLITSRDGLSGLVAKEGARRLTLDVLPHDDARTLLARLLGEERVGAEPEATAELARVCGHLPLALRIAAANLADQPQRGIASYLAELGEGNRLAALEVDGDTQAAVRAAFHLSYAALAPEARRVFRWLGLVPGPDVTPEAAAALTGNSPQQVRRLLDRLTGAHLLGRPAPGRFAFHDLLRLYATERAHHEDSQAELRAAIRRLLDWYLHNTDAAARLLYPQLVRLPLPPDEPRPLARFDDRAQALAWLDAERPNLVAAIRHAAAHGPPAVAWLLADALRGYFWARMCIVDWLASAQAGLAAAEAARDLRAQAAARLSLGDACWHQSRYQQATEHYRRALALARQRGWLEGQAATLGNLGVVDWELGQLDEAAEHHHQALALYRRTNRLAGQAATLANLGLVYKQMGRVREAADHYAESVALHREAAARSGEAVSLGNLGEAARTLGRLDDALEHLTRALTLHQELGDRGAEPETLRVLAAVHRDAGRHGQALKLANSALALARDTGDRRVEADALNTLGTVAQCLAQHKQAILHHQQALHLARETKTRYPEVEALIGLAGASERLGRLDQAHTCADQAIALALQAGYQLLEGQALTALAGIHLDQDHPDQAIRHAQQALAIHRETGHRLGEARTLVVLGLALERIGHREAALPQWQEALAVFSDIGTPNADQVRDLLQSRAR
jgi:DNA-binding SARP family transcriptional activator